MKEIAKILNEIHSLEEVEESLKNVGVCVKNDLGEYRHLGDILRDITNIWDKTN